MSETISLTVNGVPVEVPSGVTVAVALIILDEPCRTSVTGQSRGPLCAMGICYECRVTIDAASDRLACQTICAPGMDVRTHA